MADKMTVLEKILELMLLSDQDISARSAVRASAGVFKHASDLTRHPGRRKILQEYQQRQSKIRDAVRRRTKKSCRHLEEQLALKKFEVERLRENQELVVASHKAAILAVTQLAAGCRSGVKSSATVPMRWPNYSPLPKTKTAVAGSR